MNELHLYDLDSYQFERIDVALYKNPEAIRLGKLLLEIFDIPTMDGFDEYRNRYITSDKPWFDRVTLRFCEYIQGHFPEAKNISQFDIKKIKLRFFVYADPMVLIQTNKGKNLQYVFNLEKPSIREESKD